MKPTRIRHNDLETQTIIEEKTEIQNKNEEKPRPSYHYQCCI